MYLSKSTPSVLLVTLLGILLAASLAACSSQQQPAGLVTGSGQAPEPGRPAVAQSSASPLELQILSINDWEGSLEARRRDDRAIGGAAMLAAYLDEWERRAAGRGASTVRVHAGDMIGASPPISGLLQDEPTIKLLDALRFAYGAVGNHEFDEGVAELLRLQHGGPHPKTEPVWGPFPGALFHRYLAANVVWRDTGKPIFPPYVVHEVEGVGVGFIGVVRRDTPTVVTPAGVREVEFLDEAETVNGYVDELRDLGVRAIVVLLHRGGFGDVDGGPVTRLIVPMIERMSPHVDAVITGDSHQGYWGQIAGKLVTQAFAKGEAFGAITLRIDRESGQVVSKAAEIVRTFHDQAEFPPDPAVAAMVAEFAAIVAPIVDRVVGSAASAITRERSPAGESALGNLIADAQRWGMGTQIAFMNPGGIRDNVAAGPVTWGQLFNVQPFQNTLIRMTLTPEQIRRLLEQQWVGQPFPRILQVSGITYTWNPLLPEGGRVLAETVSVGGAALETACPCTVTVNSFMAGGGDNFTVLTEPVERVVGPVDLDVLVDYIATLPQPFSAAVEGRIRVP